MTVEPFNERFKTLFEFHDRVWHRGLDNNRTQILAALFTYQLLLAYNRTRGRNNAQSAGYSTDSNSRTVSTSCPGHPALAPPLSESPGLSSPVVIGQSVVRSRTQQLDRFSPIIVPHFRSLYIDGVKIVDDWETLAWRFLLLVFWNR